MNRQQALFIIIADVVLLTVIAFLVGLALNKDFVLKDRIKNVHQKKAVQSKETTPSREAPTTAAFFLRAETKTLLQNEGSMFNPLIQIHDKNLYMNTLSGSSFKFSIAENELTGRADSSFKNASSLIPFGRDFLFMDATGRFYTLFTRNMTIMPYFYYSSGGQMLDFPTISDINKDGTPDMLFPDSFSRVVCLNGKTFSPNWLFQDSSDVICRSPVILNVNNDKNPDSVFVGKDGVLYAVDGKSGWVLWKANLQQQFSSSLYSEDINRDGFKEILFVSDSGILFCFTHLGTLLWQIPLEDRTQPELLFADVNGDKINDIILTLFNGKIVVFSGISKMQLWDFQADGASLRFATTAADADKDGKTDIIMADDTPTLYVIQGTTGKEIARLPLDKAPLSQIATTKNSCYFISSDNNLHTIRFVVNK